jgi:phosphatidyl-myo-inositol alpha-mannosyltransferase
MTPVTSAPEVLRIALVCPYSLSRPGGVQGQVEGLARVLEQRGHRVSVFAPIDNLADAPPGIDLVVSGQSVPIPSNGSRAPVSISPRAVAHAVKAVRLGRFDVVHVHEPFSPGLPYGLLLASGMPPLVGTFHRSGGSIFYSLLKPVVRPLARRYAVRCAVSEAARETAGRALGGEYTVLFNGVEVDRYRHAEPWPNDGPAVLFLGRHEDRKGLRVLLEAFTMMGGVDGAVGPDGLEVGNRVDGRPTLWIAGSGPKTEWLQRMYPESDRIRWLGVLAEEEKVRRLASADVLCAPSLGGESFGMVLLEAMAARTLVVASDIDGYRQAVGGDAVLVPPGDPAELAVALLSALSSPEPDPDVADPRSERLDSASRRAERWSMSRLAEAYEQVYRRALVGGSP